MDLKLGLFGGHRRDFGGWLSVGVLLYPGFIMMITMMMIGLLSSSSCVFGKELRGT